MLSRRSFLGGIIATIGLALTNTKLPRIVDELGPEDALAWDWHPSPVGSFTILDCVFIKGDPAENDPDWIQTYGGSGNRLVIMDKTIQIAEELVIPHRPGVDRFIQGCVFRDVPLIIQGGIRSVESEHIPTDRAFIVDNTFYGSNPEGSLSITDNTSALTMGRTELDAVLGRPQQEQITDRRLWHYPVIMGDMAGYYSDDAVRERKEILADN